MSNKPDVPGPGEHNSLEYLQAEAQDIRSYDGALPGNDPAFDPRRRRMELNTAELREALDGTRSGGTRQTATERDDLRTVRAGTFTTESRSDRTPGDNQRENRFDAVQDDSGPTSDQGLDQG